MSSWSLPPAAWWIAVAVYTALLPGAIAVWRVLVDVYGRDGAGYVPALVLLGAAVFIVRRALARAIGPRGWALLAGAAAVCMLLLATASLPSKRIHVPEYLLLAWLIDRALRASGGVAWQRARVALLTAALGCVDEVLQGLIPGRFFSLFDALANAVAGAAGAMILAAASPLAKAGARADDRAAGAINSVLFVAAATALGVVQYLLARHQPGLAAWPIHASAVTAAGIAGVAAGAVHRGSPAQRALSLTCAAVLILLGGGALAAFEFR